MISLRRWLLENTLKPVLAAVICLVFIQLFYITYISYSDFNKRELGLRRLSKIVGIAINQHNRPLLESTLMIAFNEFSATSSRLCKNTRTVLSYPAANNSACDQSGTNSYLTHRMSLSIIGQQEYALIFEIPILTNRFELGFIFSISVIFIALLSFLLLNILRKLRHILSPIREGLISDEPFYIRELEELRRKIIELDTLKLQSALGSLATQVAHDIRSPLSALDVIAQSNSQMPEKKRVIIRCAIGRIRDIANNLIERNREIETILKRKNVCIPIQPRSKELREEQLPVQLLPSLIDPLITEKRIQHRSKIGVEIDEHLDASSYGLFAEIQPTEFKRVLSNLINNAVEALGDKGTVTVTLTRSKSEEGQIEISVIDNGKGIPPEVLPHLGQRGETYGKDGGSGLGLYHARTCAESWGGKLKIKSEVGKGTSVILYLPQAKTPDWFVSELKLVPQSPVVVLDDDSSIHGIWQARFDSLRVQEQGIEVLHFSMPEQLREWVNENPASKKALYLADYELFNAKQTGLDLIEELKLGPQSILVTSRFEEKQIRESCNRLKVRLIPKGMAGFVPISFEQPLERPDYVLIDDDLIVHMSWKYAAKQDGKKILNFKTPEEFLAKAPTLDKNTPIYIDSFLGNGIKGEIFAEELYKMGFIQLWLCTGLPDESLRRFTYLRGVVAKEPPWTIKQ